MPEPEAQGSRQAAPEAEQSTLRSSNGHSSRKGLWISLGVLLLAAALGIAFGIGVALRGGSFGTPAASDAAARPTFVIASPASPTPKPSQAPSPATVLSAAADEYVVESGDTLRSIAEGAYGDPTQWSRIYDANRAAIGADPDTITAGTRLTIPRP